MHGHMNVKKNCKKIYFFCALSMHFVGLVSRITTGRYFRHLHSITITEMCVLYANVIKNEI